MYITIFPEQDKSYIILSCLKSDYNIYKNFFEQLNSADINKIKHYFSLVLPLYSENIVISPRLWERWSEEQQCAYTFYANRRGKQFLMYRYAVKCGILNDRKRKFNENDQIKISLFEKI